MIMPNFVEIDLSIMKILRFLDFQNGCHHNLEFEIAQFSWLTGSGGLRCITEPYVVKIGDIALILGFLELPPCWIFEISKFYWLMVPEG